jgi:hypothetical protein
LLLPTVSAAETDTTGKPPTAGVKYVAVVETEIDEQSGASAEISRADARLVTAELRREAVKNLPSGKYNVMTSETVIAQGSAFAVDCNEENCVIALGSKIGADFIVRGIISKVQSITVEVYETNDGNLVASSEAVRSESIEELLERAAAVCAEMYKNFVAAQNPEPVKPVTYTVTVYVNPINGGTVRRNPNKVFYGAGEPLALEAHAAVGYEFTGWAGAVAGTDRQVVIAVGGDINIIARFEASAPVPPPKPKNGMSLGGGVFFAGDFGGGAAWSSGEVGMPFYGGGAYLTFDAVYAALSFAYSQGGGRWTSPNDIIPHELPYMERSIVTISISAKFPGLIEAGLYIAGSENNVSIYPIVQLDCEFPVAAALKYTNSPDYAFEGNRNGGYNVNALRAVWIKAGGGMDLSLSQSAYIRAELLYGTRTSSVFEKDNSEKTRLGHGLTVKTGVGFRM